jgi:photosystem II stability/assembly factor-like uncharacterized protein
MKTFLKLVQGSLLVGAVLLLSGCTGDAPDQSGVFLSSDSAATFGAQPDLTQKGVKVPKVYPPLEVRAVAQHQTNQDWIMAGTGDYLFRSTDRGKTWQRLTGKLPSATKSIEVNRVIWQYGTQTVYVAGVSEGYGKVYKSTDNGETFADSFTSADRGVGVTAMAVRADGSVIIGDRSGGIFSSADGITWKRYYSVAGPVTSIAVQDRTVLFGAYGQGVFKSTDNGTTYVSSSAGLSGNQLQVTSVTFAGGTTYVGSSQGIMSSRDAGSSWQPIDSPLPAKGEPVQAIAAAPGAIYVASNAVVYRLDPGTGQFRTTQLQLAKTVFDLAVFTSDPSQIVAGVNNDDEYLNRYQGTIQGIRLFPGQQ